MRNQILRGFTLIEMIVAVGIFMFVMVIAIGSLVAIVGADQKAQSIEAVVDNLRFAMDDVSRTIRTGTHYYCGTSVGQPPLFTSLPQTQDCSSNAGNYIALLDQYGHIDAYWFDSSCNANQGCIREYTATSGSYQPITSPELSIPNMVFYVVGSCPKSNPAICLNSVQNPDTTQPKVTVILSAKITQGLPQPTVLNVQTTVTQRIYDQ